MKLSRKEIHAMMRHHANEVVNATLEPAAYPPIPALVDEAADRLKELAAALRSPKPIPASDLLAMMKRDREAVDKLNADLASMTASVTEQAEKFESMSALEKAAFVQELQARLADLRKQYRNMPDNPFTAPLKSLIGVMFQTLDAELAGLASEHGQPSAVQ